MRQRGLCKRVSSRSPTRSLLPDIQEGLLRGGKYLRTCIGSTTPPEAAQYLSQRQSRQANGNFSSNWHHTPNGPALQQAYQSRQTKARSTSHQYSEQEGKDIVAWFQCCRLVFLFSSPWVRWFFINLNLSVFSFVLSFVLRVFSSNNPSVFLLSFSLGEEIFHWHRKLVFLLCTKRFFQPPAIYPTLIRASYHQLHIWRSLHPRREAIVMPWHLVRSQDLDYLSERHASKLDSNLFHYPSKRYASKLDSNLSNNSSKHYALKLDSNLSDYPSKRYTSKLGSKLLKFLNKMVQPSRFGSKKITTMF